jgi:hypothetical protein
MRSQRDIEAGRRARAEIAAIEEEELRPLREIEAKFQKSLNELAQAEKTGILHLKDKGFEMSPELRSIKTMPSIEAARQFTEEGAYLFLASNKDDYYPCPENFQTIVAFLERNGIDKYCDAATFDKAFQRLRSYGLLKDHPAPEPPPPVPKPEPPKPASATKPSEPESYQGWDENGNVKIYNDFKLNRMSADEYRRRFRLVKEQLIRPVQPCNW